MKFPTVVTESIVQSTKIYLQCINISINTLFNRTSFSEYEKLLKISFQKTTTFEQ